MTIEKHRTWAEPAEWPDGAPRVGDDATLARLAAAAVADGRVLEVILEAGDLRRTLGAPRPAGMDPYRYPCDLGFVRLDDHADEHPFAAHVAWRRRFWRGEAAVVMNAAYLGPWYLGPRSHPNDALLDVTWGALPWQQRRLAAQRARQGTHLPHPALTVRRVGTWSHEFERPTPVRADGVSIGSARRISVRVVPDAFAVYA